MQPPGRGKSGGRRAEAAPRFRFTSAIAEVAVDLHSADAIEEQQHALPMVATLPLSGSLGIDVVRIGWLGHRSGVTSEPRRRLTRARRQGHRSFVALARPGLHSDSIPEARPEASFPGSSAVPGRPGRRCAARCARPFGAVLDCQAQLRWLAMNVAPGGDVRRKTLTLVNPWTPRTTSKAPPTGAKTLLRITIRLSPRPHPCREPPLSAEAEAFFPMSSLPPWTKSRATVCRVLSSCFGSGEAEVRAPGTIRLDRDRRRPPPTLRRRPSRRTCPLVARS
jgi:hypothetical protein